MKTTINKIAKHIFVAVMVMITATAWAQEAGEIPVPLSDPSKRGKLRVHINSGSISVKGTARKDILVKYSASGDDERRSDDKGKTGLKKIGGGTLDLEVSENANYIKVQSNSWNNKVTLSLEVPSGMDMTLHTYNDGDIDISNIQGEIELTNYNGEITAESISGSLVATTYNGEIKASFEKITDGAPMSFVTYNGDIDLTLPASLKATLKMKTQQGEIRTDFDVATIKSAPVQQADTKGGTYRVKIDDWVRGTIGGGGPEFIMKNYNGDILLRKK
jgi:DUF4097 and DUF4098 domain-containing protein YvlB